MSRATIAILIRTPAGTRLLAAASEREAALSVEALLTRLPARALPAPVWVLCADPIVGGRLDRCLGEWQAARVRDRDG